MGARQLSTSAFPVSRRLNTEQGSLLLTLCDEDEDCWTEDTDRLGDALNDALSDLGFRRDKEEWHTATYTHSSKRRTHYEAAVELALSTAAKHEGPSRIISYEIEFVEVPDHMPANLRLIEPHWNPYAGPTVYFRV